MVRAKDPFWEYGDQLDKRFECKFCGKNFAGGVPRLKSHLSAIRGRDIEICTQVPPDVQAKAFLHIEGSSKKSKDAPHDLPSGSLTKGAQGTIPGILKKKDKDDVDKSVAKCYIMNNLAFNVIQTNSFKEMIYKVAHYGPDYKLPSYSTLRTKLVKGAKIDIDGYVSEVKKSWVRGGCTIMSDMWSDRLHHAFINIVAYSPSGAIFLRTSDFSDDRHTGIKIKDIMSEAIDDIGPEYVVQVVTDNGSNYLAATDMLVGKYPQLFKTRCAAHGMQLLLKDIYEQVEFVHKIVDDCKKVRDYLYNHTIVTALIRKYTNNRELKKPCVTRFASNFKMLESILDVEDEPRVLVASTDWRGLVFSKAKAAKDTVEIIQRQSFWEEGKEVKRVLEPLVRVLRLVDGEGSTAAYLYEAMERAREGIKIDASDSGNPSMYARILHLFERRRVDNIINDLHCAAAFLNPAFMYRDNFNETPEMKAGIKYMIDFLVADDETIDFLTEVQEYRMKSQRIFTTLAIRMLETSHHRMWWDYCRDSLPVLQKHAVRILSQPCSSSACERHWSAFEATQTKKRNRLTHEMLDKLVYVRMNTIAMEKFGLLEVRDMKPINMDNLPPLPNYVDPPVDGEPFDGEPMDSVDISEDDILCLDDDSSVVDE